MFLGLLSLLLLKGQAIDSELLETELERKILPPQFMNPGIISPVDDLVDGTTSIPFEHFHQVGHSIAPENAFAFHVNCANMLEVDCLKAK